MKNKEKILTNDFLNCSPEDKTLSVVMVLLIIFAPTVFYRSVSYTFYLPQLTVFWILGLLVVLILFYKTLVTGMVYKLPTTLFATLLFFSLGLVFILACLGLTLGGHLRFTFFPTIERDRVVLTAKMPFVRSFVN